jgi:hypothetical protein
MRNLKFQLFITAALLIASIPAFSDDQQKASKEINKINAMAIDFDGRRVVNLTLSETFKVERAALVQERGQTGLNYGGLFLAHELSQAGTPMADVIEKVKHGAGIADIANQQHVDWKHVEADARKFNGSLDGNLADFFLGKKATLTQDAAANYDIHYDSVKADTDVSKQDIEGAKDRFLRLKDRAARAQVKDRKGMAYGDERIADMDHVSGGGPQGGGRGSTGEAGTQVPGAMGGPH